MVHSKGALKTSIAITVIVIIVIAAIAIYFTTIPKPTPTPTTYYNTYISNPLLLQHQLLPLLQLQPHTNYYNYSYNTCNNDVEMGCSWLWRFGV
jgi:hypothetical protein